MMSVNLTPSHSVYNFSEPYIIAELGANHNGDINLARQMIWTAKECGADCVKFQSWTKDSIFSKKVYGDNHFLSDDYRGQEETLEQTVDKYSVSEESLFRMKTYADSLEIDCISTPFSDKELDFLTNSMDVPFIKIASMDVNNYPFIKRIAERMRPVVIAVGLSDLGEIDRAIQTIEETGNRQIVILHCVSLYPPRDEEVNLNRIETLRNLYPYPVGFSDHTLGYTISLAAVAKGACIVEKHFTLDRQLPGWDHKISADPTDLSIICRESKKIWKSLGTSRIARVEDNDRLIAMRRSVVARKYIPMGKIIQLEDLDVKRPGNGVEPGNLKFFIGKKTVRDIEYDDILSFQDVC